MVVRFTLCREGASDDGLLPHLEALLVRSGAHEAIGATSQVSGTVAEKVAFVLSDDPTLDAIFVHRDADKEGPAKRRREIADGAAAARCPFPLIPVVPVQETESWLLLDPAEFRAVVGRPHGKQTLTLPAPSAIEHTVGAKELLQAALLAASETTGRRRAKEKKAFTQRRRSLLERLDIDGPVSDLPSFQALRADIDALVEQMRS